MKRCDRCGVVTDTFSYASEVLVLCARCPRQDACSEYQHAYRGTQVPGQWVCLTCGATLTSVAISTEKESR
jgi:hypothetical protein